MPDGDDVLVSVIFESLTRREREVLALLAQGLTGPEIASQLSLATNSVKAHKQNIYGKLGVHTKRQAVAQATALGLLDASPTPARFEHRSRPAAKHNLPLQVTRFFGREAEIEQVQERLADNRLVTLTGSGGVGKSRLSLRVAEELLGGFQDGVWLVELAPLSDPGLVAQSVAAATVVCEDAGRPVLETLTDHLRARQLLLVLDNCEHLLEACTQLVNHLLVHCSHLKVLASSREPLGNAGEAVFVVPSLPLPAPNQPLSLEHLADYASLRLFVDRARLVFPTYHLTSHNMAAVTHVCRRLDGIPLAIEMAAARVSSLTAEQLADRLDDAFRVLVGTNRTALPRHKTLRGTIDWSFGLLSGAERLLLQRLAVFAGGWTLEAVEAVCSGEELAAHDVLEVLTALVAKSMVIGARRQGEVARYRLLETVRQYAQEKLNEAGQAAHWQARHRDYYLTFAETSIAKLNTRDHRVWRQKFEAEVDNFRQALKWSFSDLSDVEAGPRLIVAVGAGVGFRHQEALDWHIRGLALCENRDDISPLIHVELLNQASNYMALNDPQMGLALSMQAVEISRGLGPEEKERLMWCLLRLAGHFVDVGEADLAVAPLSEAEPIPGALGPDRYAPEERSWVKAAFAYHKAQVANQCGRYLDAKAYAAEHIQLGDALGSHFLVVNGHTNMGEACLRSGDYQEAREHLLAAIAPTSETEGGLVVWPVGYMWLSLADFRQGNLVRAREYCLTSIRQADEIPDRNIIASNLGILAAISATNRQSDRAARLAGASAAMWAKQKRKPWGITLPETLLPGWRDGPDAAAIQRAYAAGLAMSTDAAVAYALGEPVGTA